MQNVDITALPKGHISMLLEPTVTWSCMLVVPRVVYADMTLIPSKVKVTGHLNFRKLHFSYSFSSASLPRSSKFMVDHGSIGLQLV